MTDLGFIDGTLDQAAQAVQDTASLTPKEHVPLADDNPEAVLPETPASTDDDTGLGYAGRWFYEEPSAGDLCAVLSWIDLPLTLSQVLLFRATSGQSSGSNNHRMLAYRFVPAPVGPKQTVRLIGPVPVVAPALEELQDGHDVLWIE